MKLVPKLIIFTFFFVALLGFEKPLYAASGVDIKKECAGFDHPAYQEDYRNCLKVKTAVAAKNAGVDCIDCIHDQESSSSGAGAFVEALGAVAQPLAYLTSVAITARYQNKTQEQWAQAYASGFQQCTNRYNSYLNYSTSVGANPITPSENLGLMNSCNGNGYGGYAGYGGLTSNGLGGFGNPFLTNGFSSGFMSGYGGPFALGSSNGMLSGGIGIGAYGTTTSSAYQTGITPAFGF